MLPPPTLREIIFSHTAKHNNTISACGIRYGSVLYFAFGLGAFKRLPSGNFTIEHQVELECGANDWVIMDANGIILDSNFNDIHLTRPVVSSLFVGKKMIDFVAAQNESIITFDDGMVVKSIIECMPGSGFLYSFHVVGGPSWETIDGVTIQDEPQI